MLKNYIKYLPAAALALLIGCKQEQIELQPAEAVNKVEAVIEQGDKKDLNLSRYISLGNSLTAGVQNGALYTVSQDNSMPSMIAASFAKSGGAATFNQPTIGSENGIFNLSALATGDPLIGRLILTSVNGGSPSPAPIGAGNPWAVLTDEQKLSVDNMGVPGIRLVEGFTDGLGNAANGPGKFNPYYARFTSNPEGNYFTEAAAKKPTFISIWMGSNDVLPYATNGASTKDEAVDGQAALLDRTTLTSAATFEATYTGMLQTIFTPNPELNGVVANIPDISTIPFFNLVSYNAIPLSADQAGLLNLGFSGFNQAMADISEGLAASADPQTAALLNQSEIDKRKVLYTEGQNPILIFDEELKPLSEIITEAFKTSAQLKVLKETATLKENATAQAGIDNILQLDEQVIPGLDGLIAIEEQAIPGINQLKMVAPAKAGLEGLIGLEGQALPGIDGLIAIETQALPGIDGLIGLEGALEGLTRLKDGNTASAFLAQLINVYTLLETETDATAIATLNGQKDALIQGLTPVAEANGVNPAALQSKAGTEGIKSAVDTQIADGKSQLEAGLVPAGIIADASELDDPDTVITKVNTQIAGGKAQLTASIVGEGKPLAKASELDDLATAKTKMEGFVTASKEQLAQSLVGPIGSLPLQNASELDDLSTAKTKVEGFVAASKSQLSQGLIGAMIINSADEIKDLAGLTATLAKVDGLIANGKTQLASSLVGAGRPLSDASDLDNLDTALEKINGFVTASKAQLSAGLIAAKIIESADEVADATKMKATKVKVEATSAGGKAQLAAAVSANLATFNQARPATPEDAFTLTASTVLGTTPKGGSATQIIGTSVPLADQFTITQSEKKVINERINAFNVGITNAIKTAGLENRIAVVDMNTKLKNLASKQTTENTNNYTKGIIFDLSITPVVGLFSVDGVHLNSRGYALASNFFLEAIEEKFSATLPKTQVGLFPTNDLPVSK